MDRQCLEVGSAGKIRKRGGGGGGMMDELDLDVAWRRVGKAEVRARCAGSGAAQRASGHLQEQDFSWKSTG